MLLGLAVWIVVPPPAPLLLYLAIAVPELSPWLLLLSLLVAGIAAMDFRTHRSARVALVLAASTMSLAAIPLLQFASAARQADTAMTAALGQRFWDEVPQAARARVRPQPLSVRELLFGLRPGPVRIARGVSLQSGAGERLALVVYRPERTGTYPVLVQIYGGAWQHGAPADNALLARELARSGLVVFAVDHRHAPSWRWPAQLEDIRLALRWVQLHASEYGGDATRTALLGRSSGAQLAMLAAYSGNAGVRAVVNYYGPVDLTEGYRRPPTPDPLNIRGILEALLGGPPQRAAEAYRSASAISYLSHRVPPTLSIYGRRDYVVEPRFGSLLDARLHAAGDTSVLLQIPWAGHAFDAIPNGLGAQLALYHTERFLAWALARR
ncbi:MAG TPA: alpha/beta hydrolase [Gemmatimonadales bacterium]